MTDPNFVILYVADPSESARFYGRLLDKPPIEAAPTFAMFALESGVMLGLWARHTVAPAATATATATAAAGGGSELAFAVDGDAAVSAAHAQWLTWGLRIAQAPTQLDFGYTFVGLDPDGHRLRVFAPGAPDAA